MTKRNTVSEGATDAVVDLARGWRAECRGREVHVYDENGIYQGWTTSDATAAGWPRAEVPVWKPR